MLPTPEQTMAVDALARFLCKEIAPSITEAASREEFPEGELRQALARVAPMGIGNLRVPVYAGGSGLDLLAAGMLHETAARYVPELSGPALINESVALLLAALPAATIAPRYLAPLVAGQAIAASANTEETGGSDVRSIRTRAKRSGGDYLITGRKQWITNAHIADFVIVLARTADSDKPDLFLVDRALHGYDVRPLKVAGRVTLAELLFDEVRIPAENRLTMEGQGLSTMIAAFQSTRCFVALSAVGIADAAQDLALAHARDRKQFGKAIAATQLIQQQLADSAIEIEAARMLAYRALAIADSGASIEIESAMAKLYASEMVRRVTARASQIHGAAGLSEGMAVERLEQAARIFTVVEGTSEIQRLIIGKRLTGCSAF